MCDIPPGKRNDQEGTTDLNLMKRKESSDERRAYENRVRYRQRPVTVIC